MTKTYPEYKPPGPKTCPECKHRFHVQIGGCGFSHVCPNCGADPETEAFWKGLLKPLRDAEAAIQNARRRT